MKAAETDLAPSERLFVQVGLRVQIRLPPPASLVRTRFRSSFPLVHADDLVVVWRSKYGSDFRAVVGNSNFWIAPRPSKSRPVERLDWVAGYCKNAPAPDTED